jgi:hypothetical protein
MKRFIHKLSTFIGLVLISACASSPDINESSNSMLQNVPPEERLISPNFTQLQEQLSSLGYEGVGLQFESLETQSLLMGVFSDLRTHRREIRLVYTGLSMSYDSRHKSLTVGGTSSQEAVIKFIVEKVPQKALK